MASKSPMHVNKKNTPTWMKVVIIVIAVSFVLSLIPIVWVGLGGRGTSTSTGSDDALMTAQYQPAVDAALAAAKSSPDNPDIVSQVGHRYYEWAVAVYESGQMAASQPLWLSAVSYYNQSLALRPDDDIVLGNKAFALYYASDPGVATALEEFIAAASDNPQLTAQVENAQGLLAQVKAATPPPSGESSETTTP
jgi:tetratricopeptide (TPR) repeat protein